MDKNTSGKEETNSKSEFPHKLWHKHITAIKHHKHARAVADMANAHAQMLEAMKRAHEKPAMPMGMAEPSNMDEIG